MSVNADVERSKRAAELEAALERANREKQNALQAQLDAETQLQDAQRAANARELERAAAHRLRETCEQERNLHQRELEQMQAEHRAERERLSVQLERQLHTEIQTEKDALRTEMQLYATLAWWTQNEHEISAIAGGINEAQFGTRVEVYRETKRQMQGMAEKLHLLANVRADLREKCSMTRTTGQVCAGCETIMGGTTMDDTIRRIARHARELHAAIITNDERPSASAFLRESTSGLMKRLQAHQAAADR